MFPVFGRSPSLTPTVDLARHTKWMKKASPCLSSILTEGNSWWIAKDVCDALEIANSRDALSSLDEDEKNTVVITDGTPGNPNTSIINEPGLYSLILL